MLTAVMACGHSSRGTGSITEEFHAGVSMAVQHPPTNTSSSTVAGPPQPSSTSSVSRAKAAVWAISAPEMRRRRSLVSANTPAGRASKNMGRNTAVCTSAARKEEPVSSTISQAAAMACMPLPTKNTPPHSQSPRKAGWRRGLHKEVEEDMAAKWGQETAGAAAAADRTVEGVPTERDSISPCDQACTNPACLERLTKLFWRRCRVLSYYAYCLRRGA